MRKRIKKLDRKIVFTTDNSNKELVELCKFNLKKMFASECSSIGKIVFVFGKPMKVTKETESRFKIAGII